MRLIDTHAHPHMEGYEVPEGEFIRQAEAAAVVAIVCVGTSAQDSRRALEFAARQPLCYASVGLHPHEAKLGKQEYRGLAELMGHKKVVAVGECGLDYYYLHSPKARQKEAFRFQIELALKHDLPLIFHVRDAFSDFFKILDHYRGIRGVVHSFTADPGVMAECVERGLHIGLNGIMTFTRVDEQLDMARAVPKERLLLETDAPFLTPVPLRGKINHSANVRLVADFLAELRGEDPKQLALATTSNAKELFGI